MEEALEAAKPARIQVVSWSSQLYQRLLRLGWVVIYSHIYRPLSDSLSAGVLTSVYVFFRHRVFNPFFIKWKKTKCPSYISDTKRWRRATVSESQTTLATKVYM